MLSSILQKPVCEQVFIDTSALLCVLDSKNKRKAEMYRKLFTELLPRWRIKGIINPLVLLELVNALQKMCLEDLRDVSPSKDVVKIKKEMAKHPKFHQESWTKAHQRAVTYFETIMDLIVDSENIICEDWKGDGPHYLECKKVLPNLKSAGADGPTPADFFHVQFMTRYKLRCIITEDHHFFNIPDLTIYTSK